MNFLSTVILLLGTCFAIHVEGSKTRCWECFDCARSKEETKTWSPNADEQLVTHHPWAMPLCSTEDGFCITQIASDGKIDRFCSEDHEKYSGAECIKDHVRRKKNGVVTDGRKICRCTEDRCNDKFEKYDDEDEKFFSKYNRDTVVESMEQGVHYLILAIVVVVAVVSAFVGLCCYYFEDYREVVARSRDPKGNPPSLANPPYGVEDLPRQVTRMPQARMFSAVASTSNTY